MFSCGNELITLLCGDNNDQSCDPEITMVRKQLQTWPLSASLGFYGVAGQSFRLNELLARWISG